MSKFIQEFSKALQSQIPNILARRRAEQEEEERKRRRRQDAFALGEGELGDKFTNAALEEQWQTGVNIDNLPAARLAGLATRVRKQSIKDDALEARKVAALERAQEKLYNEQDKTAAMETVTGFKAPEPEVMPALPEGYTPQAIDRNFASQELNKQAQIQKFVDAKDEGSRLLREVGGGDITFDNFKEMTPDMTDPSREAVWNRNEILRGLDRREPSIAQGALADAIQSARIIGPNGRIPDNAYKEYERFADLENEVWKTQEGKLLLANPNAMGWLSGRIKSGLPVPAPWSVLDAFAENNTAASRIKSLQDKTKVTDAMFQFNKTGDATTAMDGLDDIQRQMFSVALSSSTLDQQGADNATAEGWHSATAYQLDPLPDKYMVYADAGRGRRVKVPLFAKQRMVDSQGNHAGFQIVRGPDSLWRNLDAGARADAESAMKAAGTPVTNLDPQTGQPMGPPRPLSSGNGTVQQIR